MELYFFKHLFKIYQIITGKLFYYKLKCTLFKVFTDFYKNNFNLFITVKPVKTFL